MLFTLMFGDMRCRAATVVTDVVFLFFRTGFWRKYLYLLGGTQLYAKLLQCTSPYFS